ncbi:Metallo-hydrolase/oxidoreductase [Rhizopus microsporus ATCC 52813]|uniref:Metallo-hydrolase/oxidoreductase n=1 Tax=Rhizopus microsporus ATCC 52813 TaxID=1340429 RepID=A0A2G4SJJ7_RHIZD|nr:Metallo-hydrolase/oxidoreductase [Rhizopus microsporus ATCC 52813]PHZ08950.1 Metallo-hydrolase/oxidoreductase [Rhizopus microsporus ATCC 52813]
MTEALVSIPTFSKLSSRVWRVLGLNPGKVTLQGTNTYILGAGAQKLLLDCGQGISEYTPLLENSLKDIQADAYISDIIISHGHFDHWGGLHDILSSSILNPKKQIRVHKFPLPSGKHVDHLKDFPQDISVLPLKDEQTFKVDDATLRVIYTPGHTSDHCTFWLEEEESLFTADCVLGQGSTIFEDLHQYLSGLEKLAKLQPRRLYPGHGPVIENGTNKINEYIRHRLEREDQIIQLFNQQDGWTPMEIVKVLYKDYPESLHLPAARSVVLHLYKLHKDGKAKTAKHYDFVQENYHLIINSKWYWVNQNNL